MGPGYQALRESAGAIDLSARGKIFVMGEDRVRLMHAMSTNHIQQLQPGQGCYAFFLNPQGRILADANVFATADRIVLDVEPEVRESLYQHLDRYIIADDVTLEDGSTLGTLGIEGPGAEDLMRSIGAPLPDAAYSHVAWKSGWVARVSWTGAPGFRIFAPAAELPSLPLVDAESARVVRIEHAKPRYSEDITDSSLPQETQQMHALHFSKGCYIGQEIVERIRSRGHVNRLLVGLHVDSAEPVPAGMKLEGDAGEVTSSAFSPALGKVVALGYVRAQLAAPGSHLKVGEFEATTVPMAGAPASGPARSAGY